MSSRNSFAFIPMACLVAAGFLGIAPMAYAAPPGQSILKPGESAGNNVIEIKYRRRGARVQPPIVPYIAYDYPYYYRRGYYPTHISGYVYYGSPYSHRRRYYSTYARCSNSQRRCRR